MTRGPPSLDTHIANVIGKGKAHIGKMDAILTGLHLDTINRIKTCMMINVIGIVHLDSRIKICITPEYD